MVKIAIIYQALKESIRRDKEIPQFLSSKYDWCAVLEKSQEDIKQVNL